MNQKLSSFNQSMLEAIEWQYPDEPVINSWTVRELEKCHDLKNMKKSFIVISLFIIILSLPLVYAIFTAAKNLYEIVIMSIMLSTLFIIPLLLVSYASIYKTKVFSYRFTNKGFEAAEWSDHYATVCKGASYFLLVIIAALFIINGLKPRGLSAQYWWQRYLCHRLCRPFLFRKLRLRPNQLPTI